MKLTHIFKIILSFLLIYSCATEKPEGKTEAEILYREAEVLMKDGRYIMATEKINQIKNRYPYSFYATPAELLQADILFKQENFIEAAAAYMLFRDFHPRHEKIPYVIYQIAESYYNQLPSTIDRDLDGAIEAIRFYNEIRSRYPNSEYIEEATTKIKECEDKLKGKEKYVADFYYRTKVWQAAAWRYQDILTTFPNDEALRTHAMKRIVSSYYYDKDYEKCITHADLFFQSLGDQDRKTVSDYKNKCQEKNNK